MTEKPFFEVFRTLEVDNQTRALFEQVVVTRVSTSPSQDVLRVYITSKKLIAKNGSKKMIYFQLFSYKPLYICLKWCAKKASADYDQCLTHYPLFGSLCSISHFLLFFIFG